MREIKDYEAHLDALAILSRAKMAAIDEAYARVREHTTFWVNVERGGDVVGAPDLGLGAIMDAYAAANGAWNRVFVEAYR